MNKHKAYHVSLLVIVLTVWLITGWTMLHWSKQWSLNQQSTFDLSERQQTILANLPPPIQLEVYVSGHRQLTRSIQDALTPIKSLLPALSIEWINPDTHPLEVQNRGITKEGQAYLMVGEQGQRLTVISPKTVVEALLSLSESGQLLVGYSQGNGERALLTDTPGAWLRFYHHFKQAGVALAIVDTQTVAAIPANIDVLLMADPQSLSERTQSLLHDYLVQGGHLIYTTDRQHAFLADTLQKMLPLQLHQGHLVDANAAQFGFDSPDFQVIELLADHDISRSLKQSPLLAGAVGLDVGESDEWTATTLLWSSENSWLETGEVKTTIKLDDNETRGPIPLAVIFKRQLHDKPQHIIVIGDSDLWADNYFTTGGNKAFAEQLLAYFNPNSQVTTISQRTLADQFLLIDERWLFLLSLMLLLGLPLALIAVGVFKWRRPCI